eukprot:snap_masked-scaffold_12-processed-gene-10.18-mRNA-1 protein AED:0.83 eAED:0.83 QI:0/0/0/0.33/1/1/3/0/1215
MARKRKFLHQIKLLLWKEYREFRAASWSYLVDLIIPMGFILLLVWLHTLDPDEQLSSKIYTVNATSSVSPTLFLPKDKVDNPLIQEFSVTAMSTYPGVQTLPPFFYLSLLLSKTDSGIAFAPSEKLKRKEAIGSGSEWNSEFLINGFIESVDKHTREFESSLGWRIFSYLLDDIAALDMRLERFKSRAFVYTNSSELDKYIKSKKYGSNSSNPKFHLALILDEITHGDTPEVVYTIQANQTIIPLTYPESKELNNLHIGANPRNNNKYLMSGFLTLQHTFENYIHYLQSPKKPHKKSGIQVKALCNCFMPYVNLLSNKKTPFLKLGTSFYDILMLLNEHTLKEHFKWHKDNTLFDQLQAAKIRARNLFSNDNNVHSNLRRQSYQAILKHEIAENTSLFSYFTCAEVLDLFLYIFDLSEEAIAGGRLYTDAVTQFALYPSPAQKAKPFLTRTKQALPVLFFISLVHPVTKILSYVSTMKQNKLLDLLFISGFRFDAVYTSFFIRQAAIYLLLSFLVSLVVKIGLELNSSLVIMWGLFFSYLCSVIGFSLLVTNVFQKPRLASIAGVGLFYILFLPHYYLANPNNLTLSANSKAAIIFQFLSPTNFASGISALLEFEGADRGYQYNNLFQSANYHLAWVVDYIKYSRYEIHEGSPAEALPEDILEKGATEPMLRAPGIIVSNLRKEYGNFCAVNDISFSVCAGDILCLLGLNGAGKSSTINMLSKFSVPTTGKILANGFEAPQICFQEDVLFPNLTVMEHLKLFSQAFYSNSTVLGAIEKELELIGLADRANTHAIHLSGGEKRKLCLLIAFSKTFIAQSEQLSHFIILDEASSGLDVNSRRTLWRYVRSKKEMLQQSLCVLFTTQYMSEAEALSDYVVILKSGEVVAEGSVPELTTKYGVGYIATVPSFHKSFKGQLLSRFQDIQVLQTRSSGENGLQILITQTSNMKLTDVLEFLESQIGKGIDQFFIHNHSLSQVFQNLNNEYKKKQYQYIESGKILPGNIVDDSGDKPPLFPVITNFIQISVSVFVMRLHNGKKDINTLFWNSLLPLCLLVLGLFLMQVIPIPDPPEMALSLKHLKNFDQRVNLPIYADLSPDARSAVEQAFKKYRDPGISLGLDFIDLNDLNLKDSSCGTSSAAPDLFVGYEQLCFVSEDLLSKNDENSSSFSSVVFLRDNQSMARTILTNSSSMHAAPTFLSVINNEPIPSAHQFRADLSH